MKTRKFENVKLNDTVTFMHNEIVITGVCSEVKKDSFMLKMTGLITIDGAKYVGFYKTGNKIRKNYNHGSAIEITGKI